MTIAIEVKNLTATYKSSVGFGKKFEYTALKDVSFEVNKGETFGVMGRNGCGKSTLLRILAGVYKPDQGQVVTQNVKTRTLLTLGLGFDATLSGRDNALLSMMLQGFSRQKAKEYLPKVEAFAELGDFFDKPVRTYSSGMKARLGFSTGITTKTDLLLIDETLAVGDKTFNAKAEAAMLDRIGGDQTVIFVSHSGPQVNKLCERAIWLEKGQVVAQGSTAEVSKQYGEMKANN